MRVEKQRQQQLNMIWAQTHRNYRGKLPDGTKTVLVLRNGGTQLVPLDDLTDAEVAKKWPLALQEKARKDAKKREAAADKIVESAYYATCNGIQIDIMDIPKVFAWGRAALEAGASYETLKAAVRDFVETIRKN